MEKNEEDVSLLLDKQGCLIQILARLPVVSLLRFKAVCKSWRDLIGSSSFIDLHTTTTAITLNSEEEFGSFIVMVIDRDFPPPEPWSHSHSILMLGGGGPEVVVDDFGIDADNLAIVGSCNGLVCLRDIKKRSEPFDVSLWNPYTGHYMILPKAKPIDRRTYDLVGFGFDVETKDYKVVQFTGLKRRWNGDGPDFCFCLAQVYSSSTDSWRLLEGIPCLPGYPYDYANRVLYLNGTCFFLAHFFYTERYPCIAENNRFIISFDFTKESITPIELPDHHRDQDLCLCSLGDKIAIFTSPKPRDLFLDDAPIRLCEDFNIWVLNYECGNSSSSVNKDPWTKLYSFQIQFKSQYDWYLPRGISNDGKFALLAPEYGRKMNLYNLETNEVKRDFLSCLKVNSIAHAYKPSLVSAYFSRVEMVQQQ